MIKFCTFHRKFVSTKLSPLQERKALLSSWCHLKENGCQVQPSCLIAMKNHMHSHSHMISPETCKELYPQALRKWGTGVIIPMSP